MSATLSRFFASHWQTTNRSARERPRETRADRGTRVALAKCESHARDFLHQGGTIDDADLKLLLVTDNIGDALEHIRTHAVEQFGLVERRMTPSRVLGERAA
jgi:hypothetical protein